MVGKTNELPGRTSVAGRLIRDELEGDQDAVRGGSICEPGEALGDNFDRVLDLRGDRVQVTGGPERIGELENGAFGLSCELAGLAPERPAVDPRQLGHLDAVTRQDRSEVGDRRPG